MTDFLCRPLPSVVAPVLDQKLKLILGMLSASFPPAAACLRATATTSGATAAASGSAAMELMDDSDDDMEGQSLLQCLDLLLPFSAHPEDACFETHNPPLRWPKSGIWTPYYDLLCSRGLTTCTAQHLSLLLRYIHQLVAADPHMPVNLTIGLKAVASSSKQN